MAQWIAVSKDLQNEGQDEVVQMEQAEKNEDKDIKTYQASFEKHVNDAEKNIAAFKQTLAQKKADEKAIAEGRDIGHERSDQDKADMAAFLAGKTE